MDELHTAWNENYGWYDYNLSYTNIGTTTEPDIGWFDIDITQAVNDWLADPQSNFGIQLRPFYTDNNFDRFVSSDAIGDFAQFRPELVISYDNQNFFPTVNLDHGSVAVEMLRLADEVYGPLKPLSHSAEGLGSYPVAGDAQERGWNAATAAQLGMAATNQWNGPGPIFLL